MKSKLNVPQTILIGQQKRTDTYTGRLGYVIYKDEKGKIRKETSWQGWRDKSIEPIITDNIPMEGFVLNRNGGGNGGSNHYDWYERKAFIRVYDPRDFEFEISVENLLFILRYADCSRGKGLEGKFLYAWDGKDLVLLPEGCNEYQESVEFTSLKTMKVGAKELVPGQTYHTKDQENLVYLGKYSYRTNTWRRNSGYIDEYLSEYVFYRAMQTFEDYRKDNHYASDTYYEQVRQQYENSHASYQAQYDAAPEKNESNHNYYNKDYYKNYMDNYSPEKYAEWLKNQKKSALDAYTKQKFVILKTNKLAKITDTNIHPEFANYVNELEASGRVLLPGTIKVEKVAVDTSKPGNKMNEWQDGYTHDIKYIKLDENRYKQVSILVYSKDNHGGYSWYSKQTEPRYTLIGFILKDECEITYDGTTLKRKDLKEAFTQSITPADLNNIEFYDLTTIVDGETIRIK